MRKQNKILFAAQDPGGFNALINVTKNFKKSGILFKVFLAKSSVLIARKNKIYFVDCSNLKENKILKLFNEFKPNVVVSGTSIGLSLDKTILIYARSKKIPVISIIDFWSVYKNNFSDPGKKDLAYLPDIICVIDESMKREMIKLGFNRNILKVTGNPFFDKFKKVKKTTEKFLLFISQPFSEINLSGFNEVEILRNLVKVLEEIKIKKPLLISFHPRGENKEKYNQIIKQAKIKIKLSKKNGDDLLDQAAVVFGINSMALFLSAMKGKKVVSIQPGNNKQNDFLMSNHLGLSLAVYDFKKLKFVINKLILKKSAPKQLEKIRKKYVENDSTKRVVAVIKKYL